MNDHVHEYYNEFTDDFTPSGHFHKVLPLHESADVEWEDISRRVAVLPKGWYELSRLKSEDRIEFLREFWFSKLPFVPHAMETIANFFNELDNIGVYVTQKAYDDPYEVQLVYSLKGNKGFYHGSPPQDEPGIVELEKEFLAMVKPANYLPPSDFMAFLAIHDGFSKYTDTGVIPSKQISAYYGQFQQFLSAQEPLSSVKGEEVNPRSLIPFYESFGLHCYQCFWGDWYPEQEMGNVYYSGIDKCLSKVGSEDTWQDNMAFPNFLSWLAFYLESIE